MKSDKEIRQSIRAAIDDCTRGIDEAPSLQFRIAQKARGKQPVKKKISLRIICIIAALLLGTMTALAAGDGNVNAMLYKLWPEAARALRPLNLSDEHAGIRLDVISATLNDEHYLVTYSLTDTGGDRIGENTDCTPTLEIPLSGRSGWNKLLSFDPENHRAVYGAYFEYQPLPGSEEPRDNDPIGFTVTGLENPVQSTADLLPLMDGRDYRAEAVPAPQEYFLLDTDAPEGEAVIPDVLNPANNLHIPLADGVELSGIGWIGGSLHIQVHIPDYEVKAEKEYAVYGFARYTADIALIDGEGNDFMRDTDLAMEHLQDNPGFVREIQWGEGSGLWIEKNFPVQPDEMASYTANAEITYLRSGVEDLLQHEWKVSFPANMIRAEE